VTECSMSDNVAAQHPDISFVRPCQMCPYMKRITLKNIRQSLENMTNEITIPVEIAQRARLSVERMIAVN
jgi:quinolinate synthase